MVKAEEALKSLLKIQPTTNNCDLIAHTEKAKDFIKQHLTPTFDEVVKAWKNSFSPYGVNVVHNSKYNIVSVYVDGSNQSSIVVHAHGYEPYYTEFISSKEVESSLLTIRYLEGKKEKENGK